MAKIVNIDFNDFLKNTLPYFLRDNTHLNWIYSLLKPLRHVHDIFYSFYIDKRYFLYHTAQTVYIEHYLNTKYNISNPSSANTPANPFNATNEDVYIVNNNITGQVLFNESESIDNEDEVYLYNDSEYPLAADAQEYYLYNVVDVGLGDGFTVYVPNSILTASPFSSMSYVSTIGQVNDIIEAAVNKFKFAQTSFSIVNY